MFFELSTVLEEANYIVICNKKVMIPGSCTPATSVCYSSQPDFIAFNSRKSVSLSIDISNYEAEYSSNNFIGEENQKKVKGLDSYVSENKLALDQNIQQFLGNVEKGLGEVTINFAVANVKEKMFKCVDTYALSIYHQDNKVKVRKVRTDFEQGVSEVRSGKQYHSIEEALNRLLTVAI